MFLINLHLRKSIMPLVKKIVPQNYHSPQVSWCLMLTEVAVEGVLSTSVAI